MASAHPHGITAPAGRHVARLAGGPPCPAARPTALQPDPATRLALAAGLEATLDAAAAQPNPGHRPFQRLNRAEYAAAIRTMFGIDVDVATLESSAERAALAVARARAELESAIKSNQVRLEFGVRRYDRTIDMFKKDLIPVKEMDEAETGKILAELGLLEAQENRRLAELELQRATVAVGLRTIRSPTTGFVMERALSPAINAPTTAVLALDQLHRLLRYVGQKQLHPGRVSDGQGTLRLLYPTPQWEDFVVLATSEIRLFGASSLQVPR